MKTSEKILQHLEQNGRVTGNALVDYLGITDRGVRKQLKTLLDAGTIMKIGKPPRVYYSIAPEKNISVQTPTNIDKTVLKLIEKEFLYISPLGASYEGWAGFIHWCNERKLDPRKTAERYQKTLRQYYSYRNNDGLIDGMYKLKSTFDDVALDHVFYVDFYSIEIFGKTKLGQLLLFAKQSQNKKLMNEITDIIKPSVTQIIKQYQIDGVGFIPPTVKRETQLMKLIQNRLNLNVRTISLNKIKTAIAIPQKTLSKLDDRGD
jgi:predicted HTH transcriptional regulator